MNNGGSSIGNSNKTILVKDKVWSELFNLKNEMGCRSINDVIFNLISVYRKYIAMVHELNVMRLMCTEFLDSRASLNGWVNVLRKRLSKDEVPIALTILKFDGNDIYVVDKEKCMSFLKTIIPEKMPDEVLNEGE